MTIKQNLVSASKYALKCPNPMTPIGICVHNTANDASAKNEISYMIGNTSSTSFHIAVDDVEAVQGLPLDRNGWHAGDGSNGVGNRQYIGIEICYSKSGGEKFDKAEENAAELIAQLLKQNGWGVERVKKHQDFSGKYCPHRTLDRGWDRFLNMIKAKLGGSMADMYTLPSGNKVDISNRDTNIATAKTWDEVVHQKIWEKKSDADKRVEDARREEQRKTEGAVADREKNLTHELAQVLKLEGEVNFADVVNEVKRLKDTANQNQGGSGTGSDGLPTTYNGRRVVGVIIDPQ